MQHNLSDFDFSLPHELIAQYPLSERSASRLLCVNRENNTYQHLSFRDLPQLLNSGDLLVFNDTRVIPARIYAHKISGGLLPGALRPDRLSARKGRRVAAYICRLQ